MRKRAFLVQTFVLALLIPVILVVTFAFGARVYQDLYGIILRGFDQKLFAVSTVTAEFVRGEDHDVVLGARRLNAFAQDPGTGELYGRDSEDGTIVHVDRRTGGARPAPMVPALRFEASSSSPDGARWRVVGPELVVERAGTARTVGRIVELPGADGDPGDTIPVGLQVDALHFDAALGVLFGATDGLVTIDTASAQAARGDFTNGFLSEAVPEYARYVHPMRRIMRKKDITYLYTQILFDDGTIVYGLDGTEGSDHSPPGYEDVMPADEMAGTQAAMMADGVHLSKIQEWEQWGLLKSAFAPIRTADGTVNAMSGADVNISIIQEKTRDAIARVGLVAIVTLLLGGLVSFWVSRKLVEPLNDVKDGALRVAAGEYGHQIAPQPIAEIDELARHFNAMSRALNETVQSLARSNREVDAVRRRRELEFALGTRNGSVAPPFEVLAAAGPLDPSGYHAVDTAHGPVLVGWFGALAAKPLDALRLRGAAAVAAERLVQRYGAQWDVLKPRLDGLFAPELNGWVVIDAATRAVHWTGASLSARTSAGAATLPPSGSVLVAPGDRFIVAAMATGIGITA